MIETYPAPDHVAAFHIAGTLTGEDYDKVVAGIQDKLSRHDRIGVLVDLTGFDDFTGEALWKDTRYSLSLLGELKRFPREAVISDKKWVHTLARIASPLVPKVEVRAFTSGQREAALAWVAELPGR
jgi:hypothetical protein